MPTLEEYDRFLSLSTHLSTIFVPPIWPHYRKRLTDLLGFKRPVVEALTWHGSEIGRSMSFDFLYDRFLSLECLVSYRDDFVDLEERWTSYRRHAFLVAFFGAVLFPSSSGAVNFVVLPLVSALPHGTSFIHAQLFETIRSLSLCRETGKGRLGCCVHLLQLWFCSHLSVIAKDQPEGFAIKSRVRAIVVLNLPFSGDIEGWLGYLCCSDLKIRPIDERFDLYPFNSLWVKYVSTFHKEYIYIYIKYVKPRENLIRLYN